MASQNRYKTLAKNTVLFAFGSFGSRLISFFLVPLYTSILSTADYGTADMINVVRTIMASVCTLCIADAVMLFAMQQKEKLNQVFSYALKIISLSIVFIGAGIVLLWRLHAIKWADYCYLFLFLEYVFFVLNNLLTNFVTALEKVTAVAVAGVLTTLATVTGSIVLLVVLKLGIVGYLIAICFGLFASSVFYVCVLVFSRTPDETGSLQKIRLTKNIEPSLKREMIAYSLPLIFNAVSWWVNGSLDRFFIVAFVGIAQSGIYSIASKIPSILAIVQSIFAQAWSLSSVKESGSDTRGEFYGNIYALYTTLMVISSSLLILANNFLARFLYAKDFNVAKEYSAILIVSSAISGIGGILSSTFSITKKTSVLAYTSVITAVINTILNAVLIPRFGNYGAAIATTAAFFVMWLMRYYKAQQLIPFKHSLFKDLVAFGLLAVQVVLSHYSGLYLGWYFGQAVILAVLVSLYWSHIKQIIMKAIGFARAKVGK